MVTTTDNLRGRKLFKCDNCRKETAVTWENTNRRRLCIECMPADQRAVFGVEPEDDDADVEADDE